MRREAREGHLTAAVGGDSGGSGTGFLGRRTEGMGVEGVVPLVLALVVFARVVVLAPPSAVLASPDELAEIPCMSTSPVPTLTQTFPIKVAKETEHIANI